MLVKLAYDGVTLLGAAEDSPCPLLVSQHILPRTGRGFHVADERIESAFELPTEKGRICRSSTGAETNANGIVQTIL